MLPRPSRPIRTLPSETEAERMFRWTLWLVFLVTLARLAWLAAGHTDLAPGEALYWAWSRTIATGYYAKPPMVAWIIAGSTALFHHSGPAVRLPAPLIQFAAALAIYGTAIRLYDARTAFWSAIAYATLIGVSYAGVIMSAEAPLVLAWAVALYAFVRARESGERRWWLLVGIAFGLGLLSQYAMIYWLAAALIYVLAVPAERRHLPMLLGAAALGLVIYSPNFLWNAAHGYVSYRDTEAMLGGMVVAPNPDFAFLGVQLAVFGPLFCGAFLAMLGLWRRALSTPRTILLLTFTLVPLLAMLGWSFVSPTDADWALPAYVAGTILVVGWLLAEGRRIVVIIAIALNLVAAAVVMIGIRDISVWVGMPVPVRLDPLHRLEGWRNLGRAVTSLLLQHPGALLLTDDRDLLATLMFYVRPPPVNAIEWNSGHTVRDQFALTQQPALDLGADFLLVAKHSRDVKPILARFARVGPPQTITVFVGSHGASKAAPPLMRRYKVYYLEGFKGFSPGG
ncbi:MAG: glycosyltransferase family 39 protein [Stellaceae bacterium]